jgi:hypothetical protein
LIHFADTVSPSGPSVPRAKAQAPNETPRFGDKTQPQPQHWPRFRTPAHLNPVHTAQLRALRFRLPRVASINTSGDKYGLVHPGVGWVVWRDVHALPDDLVFKVNYLAVLRIVVRNGFSHDLSDLLIDALHRALPRLEHQHHSQHGPETASFSHGAETTTTQNQHTYQHPTNHDQ